MTGPAIGRFDVQTVLDDKHITLVLSGEFDAAAVERFESALPPEPRSGRVVVDLEATSLLDSAALGALLRLHRDLVAAGGSIAVRAPLPFQQRLFGITGLEFLLLD